MRRPADPSFRFITLLFALTLAMVAAGCSSDSGSDAGSDLSAGGTADDDTGGTTAPESGDDGTDEGGDPDDTVGAEETTTSLPPETDGPAPLVFTPSTSSSFAIGPYWLLGGWDGSNWADAEGEDPSVFGVAVGDSFTVVNGPAASGATVAASDIDLVCEPIEYPFILTNPSLQDMGDAIAVDAPWNLQPRAAATNDSPDAVYLTAAQDFLNGQGYAGGLAPLITQWFKVDLEGDGVDEVVFTIASRDFDDFPYGDAGDFSAVLLRKVVEEEVQTAILGYDTVEPDEDDGAGFNFIGITKVIGFADLNGDTKMEIITAESYYEGSSSSVWEYVNDDLGPVVVLDGGCGA